MVTPRPGASGRRIAEEDRAIGAKPGLNRSAEQAADRLPSRLSRNIPESNVDARHGVAARTHATVVIGGLIHLQRTCFDGQGIRSHQSVRQAVADLSG